MSEKTLTVLQIDDKTITSDLDRAGYRKMGVTIKNATSFQSASDILEGGKDTIDIIVINVDYDGIDAKLTCQHFKSNATTKDIPVVFTSVQDKARKFKKMVEIGMDLFVELPVPRQFFVEKLKNLADQQTRENERVDYEGTVEFKIEGTEFSCKIAALSRSGLLILSPSELKLETDICMTFTLPTYKKPIKVDGKIVRKIDMKEESNLGFGVRFQEFKGDSEKRLEKYISKSSQSDPKMVYYL